MQVLRDSLCATRPLLLSRMLIDPRMSKRKRSPAIRPCIRDNHVAELSRIRDLRWLLVYFLPKNTVRLLRSRTTMVSPARAESFHPPPHRSGIARSSPVPRFFGVSTPPSTTCSVASDVSRRAVRSTGQRTWTRCVTCSFRRSAQQPDSNPTAAPNRTAPEHRPFRQKKEGAFRGCNS